MGAFVAGSEAGRPVLPVGIRGTRSMLRPGHRFVRRGALSVVVGEPIVPTGRGWPAAVRLERGARAAILRSCGEPDTG
jgi:1-acyl-sn-glycerol-3-phosphate acyltransferase